MTNKNKWLIGVGGLLTAATSAFFILKKKNLIFKKDDVHEKPPRKAPQLSIENPGSQDNFPVAPSESEIG